MILQQKTVNFWKIVSACILGLALNRPRLKAFRRPGFRSEGSFSKLRLRNPGATGLQNRACFAKRFLNQAVSRLMAIEYETLAS